MVERKQSEKDTLTRAVEAWRGAPPVEERIGDETRERILRAAAGRAALRWKPQPPLFTPRAWLLAATALPVLLTAFLFAVWQFDRRPAAEGFTRVEASKQGDEVVFRIANGRRVHTVYRSTESHRFDPSSAVRVTDGVYRDRLEATNLVFYRID